MACPALRPLQGAVHFALIARPVQDRAGVRRRAEETQPQPVDVGIGFRQNKAESNFARAGIPVRFMMAGDRAADLVAQPPFLSYDPPPPVMIDPPNIPPPFP